MLVKFNFLSQALRMQTNVTMVLPSFTFADAMKGKADSYVPGTTFQTVYLLHGGYGDDSDYVNFTNIVRYADDHKVAVVMPAGYNSSYEDKGQDGDPLGGKFWTYVSEELPQVCQSMFPLSPRREDTFAAGLSMGAMGAMRLAILNGERFHSALLMSGTCMDQTALGEAVTAQGTVDPAAMEVAAKKMVHPDMDIFRRAARNVEEGKPLVDLYMTCGSEDFLIPAVHAARDLLGEIGYTVRYEEVPGYTHEWDFWDLSLRKAFEEWLPIRHEVILPE